MAEELEVMPLYVAECERHLLIKRLVSKYDASQSEPSQKVLDRIDELDRHIVKVTYRRGMKVGDTVLIEIATCSSMCHAVVLDICRDKVKVQVKCNGAIRTINLSDVQPDLLEAHL